MIRRSHLQRWIPPLGSRAGLYLLAQQYLLAAAAPSHSASFEHFSFAATATFPDLKTRRLNTRESFVLLHLLRCLQQLPIAPTLSLTSFSLALSMHHKPPKGGDLHHVASNLYAEVTLLWISLWGDAPLQFTDSGPGDGSKRLAQAAVSLITKYCSQHGLLLAFLGNLKEPNNVLDNCNPSLKARTASLLLCGLARMLRVAAIVTAPTDWVAPEGYLGITSVLLRFLPMLSAALCESDSNTAALVQQSFRRSAVRECALPLTTNTDIITGDAGQFPSPLVITAHVALLVCDLERLLVTLLMRAGEKRVAADPNAGHMETTYITERTLTVACDAYARIMQHFADLSDVAPRSNSSANCVDLSTASFYHILRVGQPHQRCNLSLPLHDSMAAADFAPIAATVTSAVGRVLRAYHTYHITSKRVKPLRNSVTCMTSLSAAFAASLPIVEAVLPSRKAMSMFCPSGDYLRLQIAHTWSAADLLESYRCIEMTLQSGFLEKSDIPSFRHFDELWDRLAIRRAAELRACVQLRDYLAHPTYPHGEASMANGEGSLWIHCAVIKRHCSVEKITSPPEFAPQLVPENRSAKPRPFWKLPVERRRPPMRFLVAKVLESAFRFGAKRHPSSAACIISAAALISRGLLLNSAGECVFKDVSPLTMTTARVLSFVRSLQRSLGLGIVRHSDKLQSFQAVDASPFRGFRGGVSWSVCAPDAKILRLSCSSLIISLAQCVFREVSTVSAVTDALLCKVHRIVIDYFSQSCVRNSSSSARSLSTIALMGRISVPTESAHHSDVVCRRLSVLVDSLRTSLGPASRAHQRLPLRRSMKRRNILFEPTFSSSVRSDSFFPAEVIAADPELARFVEVSVAKETHQSLALWESLLSVSLLRASRSAPLDPDLSMSADSQIYNPFLSVQDLFTSRSGFQSDAAGPVPEANRHLTALGRYFCNGTSMIRRLTPAVVLHRGLSDLTLLNENLTLQRNSGDQVQHSQTTQELRDFSNSLIESVRKLMPKVVHSASSGGIDELLGILHHAICLFAVDCAPEGAKAEALLAAEQIGCLVLQETINALPSLLEELSSAESSAASEAGLHLVYYAMRCNYQLRFPHQPPSRLWVSVAKCIGALSARTLSKEIGSDGTATTSLGDHHVWLRNYLLGCAQVCQEHAFPAISPADVQRDVLSLCGIIECGIILDVLSAGVALLFCGEVPHENHDEVLATAGVYVLRAIVHLEKLIATCSESIHGSNACTEALSRVTETIVNACQLQCPNGFDRETVTTNIPITVLQALRDRWIAIAKQRSMEYRSDEWAS